MKARLRDNIILFSLSFLYVFIIGLFDDLLNTRVIYYICISMIYVVSFLTIKLTNRHFYGPLIVIILTWISEIVDLPFIHEISSILSSIFFFVIVVLLIIRVAKSNTVGIVEFLESINVYLLLGIAASVLFGLIYSQNNDAYNQPGETLSSQSDFIYYSFVTTTTLGYGDITPANSFARSLSIFFSVLGQLYLTMIIALLVGKYIGGKQVGK